MFLRFTPCLCLVMLLVNPPAHSKEPDGGWKAGLAKVNITPDNLMWMSGYAARTKPAEGKQHDLWAKALALEDPSGRRGEGIRRGDHGSGPLQRAEDRRSRRLEIQDHPVRAQEPCGTA